MGEHEAREAGDTPVPGPVDPVDTPPDEPRPEPVLSAARVAGVVSGVILGIGGVLKLVGVLVPRDYDLQALADQTSYAVLALGAAWAVIGPYLTARLRARDKVTPLADPRDAYGRKLVPEER
jgi:hypothetical protein